jgi:hypothetical protein
LPWVTFSGPDNLDNLRRLVPVQLHRMMMMSQEILLKRPFKRKELLP